MSISMVIILWKLKYPPSFEWPLTAQFFPTCRISPFLENFSSSIPRCLRLWLKAISFSPGPRLPQAFLSSKFDPIPQHTLTWKCIYLFFTKLLATNQPTNQRDKQKLFLPFPGRKRLIFKHCHGKAEYLPSISLMQERRGRKIIQLIYLYRRGWKVTSCQVVTVKS